MFSPISPEGTCGIVLKTRTESMIQEVCESLTSWLSLRPEAIVLRGSFARDEGSVLMAGGRLRMLGDMEYMVVFSPGADRRALQRFLDEQEVQLRTELFSRGMYCDLEFRATYPEYFHRLSPQIQNIAESARAEEKLSVVAGVCRKMQRRDRDMGTGARMQFGS